MNETETLEIPEQNAIIQAIMKRFDDVDMQLKVIREGIAFNSAAFDKLEAKFFDARSALLT